MSRPKITITVDEWMLKRVLWLAEDQIKEHPDRLRTIARYDKICVGHIKKQIPEAP